MSISFTYSLRLYEHKRIPKVFLKVDGAGLENEFQKPIWMTWKMNIETVSETACSVIRAFAQLAPISVPEELAKRLHSRTSSDDLYYLKVFKEELVGEASLVHESRKYNPISGRTKFRMICTV